VKKGSRLFIELKDDKIIITPEPDNYASYYYGLAKGTYGETSEEIDAYVQEERSSWD
jgi:hypothetical protein